MVGRITVQRIRLTLSRSTGTTYTFLQARTSDAFQDTENLSSCALPSCTTLLVAEGVQYGKSFDFQGPAFELPRGARLYFHTDADIGSAYQTIEVSYSEK